MLNKSDLGTVGFDEVFAVRLLARHYLASLPKADIEALIDETENGMKTLAFDDLSPLQLANLGNRGGALLNLLREASTLAK